MIDGSGDSNSLKENTKMTGMMTRSKSAQNQAVRGTIKPNRAQMLRNAQIEKVKYLIIISFMT